MKGPASPTLLLEGSALTSIPPMDILRREAQWIRQMQLRLGDMGSDF